MSKFMNYRVFLNTELHLRYFLMFISKQNENARVNSRPNKLAGIQISVTSAAQF